MALIVQGFPRELGPALRRALRPLAFIVGGVGSGVLWWFDEWGWLPVPLAGAFLMVEMVVASRHERPLQLRLEEDRVGLLDPAGPDRDIAIADLFAVTLLSRALRDGRREHLILLVGHDDIVLAIPVQSDRALGPHEIDLDAEVALAGIGHLGRSTTPGPRLFRQVVHDGRVLDWIRRVTPNAAFSRLAVAAWRGKEPPLDVFGYHEAPPDGWLRMDGAEVCLIPHPITQGSLRVAPRTFQCSSARLGRTHRSATLLSEAGATTHLVNELPLLVIDFGGLRIALPAPGVPLALPMVELDDEVLHMHAAQGAIILAHLRARGLLLPQSDSDRRDSP